ncbi:hypothetical protein PSHT_12903 [Puccinia striiformis]|uniref:Deacetylase sirtuin-type domain-containing protein n=1 Tax=Puccinia striiformis TaxID=27350 RepID=A0A2S4UTS3_9BASI|nr:hypothetical protein PSHT_12903 [Puccinia striiformis]
MISSPSDSQSESSSGSSSPAEVIRPEQMMDWKEWEGCMRKIQSRGLTRFLNRYVVNKRTDIQKFLVNLEVTISIVINEQSTDDDEDKNLDKIQALVRLENSILKFLKARKKSPEYNSIDDAVSLIQRAEKILILTGAGISTSCGIPDFRSENGLYSQLEDYEGLDDPHDMFVSRFLSKKSRFSHFQQQLPLPPANTNNISSNSSSNSNCSSGGGGNNGTSRRSTSTPTTKSIIPSDSHRFIKMVEYHSKLLRNYTQNIDTLEMRAGVKNLIQCHGSIREIYMFKISKAEETSKMEASKKAVPSHKRRKVESAYRFDAVSSDDDPDIDWVDLGLMKPDIIFFGEGLPTEFDEAIESDRFECDLVIVIGTSLKVAPVSEIIKYVPDGVPQILINRDPIYHGRRKTAQTQGEGKFEYEGDEFEFDICLFGQSDLILRELSRRLGPGWQLDQPSSIPGVPSTQNNSLANPLSGQQEQQQDISINEGHKPIQFSQFGQHVNHIWLFPGANVTHTWFDRWRILDRAGGNPSNGNQDPSSSEESDSEPTNKASQPPPPQEDKEKTVVDLIKTEPEPNNHPNVTGNHPLIDSPAVLGLHQDKLAPGNSQAQAPSRNESTALL